MSKYLKRAIDQELDELLPSLAAIALEGPKGVGKTETALRRASTVHALDDPASHAVAKADPARLLQGKKPILIDEWQRLPETWDLVRRSVDRDHAPAQFLLAGSASPLRPPTHSGAGRIVSLRMRPLTLFERGFEKPTVSLGQILQGGVTRVEGETSKGLEDYVHELFASGFPGFRHLSGRALRAQLDGYLDRIVDRDFPQQGMRLRNPQGLSRWMRAYAAATATTASFETVRDAATAGESNKLAKTTVQPYREVLEQLWILDPMPAWLPSRNRLNRLAQAPKHHLADPALAVRLLGLDEAALLDGVGSAPLVPRDGTLLGHMFESLVTLSVRVAAQAAEAGVGHLRLHGGNREIDMVVVRPDEKVVAIEVKLSASIDDNDVRNLHWLQKQLGKDYLAGLVINTGRAAYRRSDGVFVVPAALLGL